MNLGTIIRQNSVASFIILTLGLSFAAILLPAPPESAFVAVVSVDVMIPTIVAFVLVTLTEGRQGAAAFLRQTIRWRRPFKWYLIALAVGGIVPIGSSVLALVTGRITALGSAAPTTFVIVIFLFALLEEIGWRGFALRRLLEQHTPFTATLIVGIPWALLHFGLWVVFVPNVSPIGEGLAVLTLASLHTWIFVRSGRSVLIATVLHGAVNSFGSLVSTNISPEEGIWFLLASAVLVAAILLLADWRMWFARPAETEASEMVPSTVS
jgi:membrane protease YdiL (CAAX protease family)